MEHLCSLQGLTTSQRIRRFADMISGMKMFSAELKGVWNVIQVRGNRILLKYSKSPSNQLLYFYDFGIE